MGCVETIRTTRIPQGTEELAMLNHCITHRTSYLAARLLQEDHPLSVCHSGAGYYLGCNDLVTGEPISRDSQEYWDSKEYALQVLENRTWTQRMDA